MELFLQDIPGYESWESIEEAGGDWINNKKYLIRDKKGNRFVLRLSDSFLFEDKKKEYERIKLVNSLPCMAPQAAGFDLCGRGQFVYTLLSCPQGRPLSEALPSLPEGEQAALGQEAGKLLKSLHALPINAADQVSQDQKATMLQRLARYEQSDVRMEDDEALVSFIREGIEGVCKTPLCYIHGNFAVKSLLMDEEGKVGFADLDHLAYGDPFEDLVKIQTSASQVSVPFAKGELKGYCAGEPEEDFWQALAVSVAYGTLTAINWAKKDGAAAVAAMSRICQKAYDDYDGFTRVVPRWFR